MIKCQKRFSASYFSLNKLEFEMIYSYGYIFNCLVLFQVSSAPEQWANEFSTNEKHISTDDQWVNEFSKLHVDDWADEFGEQVGRGVFGENTADDWAQAYDE